MRHLAAGVLAVVPWCLLEVALGSEHGPRAWFVAFAVGLGAGLLLGGASSSLRGPTLLRLVAFVPPAALWGRSVIWAVQRACELWLPHSAAAGLLVTAVILVPIAVRLCAVRRVWPIQSRFWRGVAGVAPTFALFWVLLPVVMLKLDLAARIAAFAAIGVAWLALATGWRERWTMPLAAVASGIAATLLPRTYLDLEALAVWTCIGAGLLAIRGPEISSAVPVVRRRVAAAVAGIAVSSLASWAVRASPASFKGQSSRAGVATALMAFARSASDFDRDGYGEWFGEIDCRPFDARVNPGAREIERNGVDDNCRGGDRTESVSAWLARTEPDGVAPPAWSGDVVVVLFDALRADESRSGRTPTIAALRARGLDYTRAYATSTFTPESLLGILTARMVSSTPFHWRAPYNGCPSAPVHGLPLALSRLGRATALIGSPEGTTDCFSPIALGDGFRVRALMPYFAPAEAVTDRAIGVWNDLGSRQPRFLFVHYLEAHNAYESVDAYHRAVVRTDRALGRLVAALGDQVLWVVLSDHGEELGERGARGHANTLFEEVARVTLVIAGPPIRRGRIDRVVSLLHLPGTLLRMADPSRRDVGPALCVDPTPGACPDRAAPLELERPGLHLRGLVVGRTKIVRDVDHGWLQAYDLERDPGEIRPLSPIPSPWLARLGEWEEYGFSAQSSLYPIAAP